MKLKKITILSTILALLIALTSTALAAGFLVKDGSKGEQVKEVQTLLQEKDFYHGEITGVCDKATVAAIKAFQRKHHLEVDGICGPITYRKLKQDDKKLAEYTKGRLVMVTATGYSAQDPGNNPKTASGTRVRHGEIAVDSSVIPLGTHVYIPDYGEAIAEDIGWGIKGMSIDIAFDTHEEALEFGRKTIEIYILD